MTFPDNNLQHKKLRNSKTDEPYVSKIQTIKTKEFLINFLFFVEFLWSNFFSYSWSHGHHFVSLLSGGWCLITGRPLWQSDGSVVMENISWWLMTWTSFLSLILTGFLTDMDTISIFELKELLSCIQLLVYRFHGSKIVTIRQQVKNLFSDLLY